MSVINNTPPAIERFVRPSWKTSLDSALSYSTRSILSAFRLAQGGHPELYIEIPGKPPSANKMYSKQANIGGRGTFFMSKDVKTYRDAVMAACWRKTFVPRGTVAVVVAIESPNWVTKKHTVRIRDIDNPLKTVLDSLQNALQMRDELIFEIFASKLFGRRDMTHVWLFDIGDVIPALGAQTCLSQPSA